jgi:hypothetical protein
MVGLGIPTTTRKPITMNINRILSFTVCCLGTTFVLSELAEGASIFENAFLFIVAIGSGYAYGTFQMYRVYEQQVVKMMASIRDNNE